MTGLQSFVAAKCPQCRQGDIFQGKFLSKKFKTVNTNCSHCGVKFESEPGFFWGAMYFSYALVVATIIIAGIVMYSIYDEPPLFQTSAILIGISMLLTPIYLRLSRLLLIYLAAPYKNYKPEL